MEICSVEKCTGCMACYSSCPVDAIRITSDIKGFYIPVVDDEKCIKCGKCRKTCPSNINVIKEVTEQNVYASWLKNKETRANSTSGGLFSAIANYIIDNDGVVFGARFDDNFKVIHSFTDNKIELFRYRGSKYVQSNIGDSFKQSEQFLKQGKKVFFTGTPCQIAGLKNFVKKDYPNLFTADIVCHGVPSPMVFDDYLKHIKSMVDSNITNISFRYKKPSWTIFSMKIDFKDQESYIKDTNTDPYIVGFLTDLFTKDCCATCKYTNLNRGSDITMADFWGYTSEEKEYRNTEEGISLILVNTDAGRQLLDHIKNDLIIIEKTIDEALEGNQCLSRPFKKNPNEKEFWAQYLETRDFSSVIDQYCAPKKMKVRRSISLFYNDHAYVFTKNQRGAFKKIKHNVKKLLK